MKKIILLFLLFGLANSAAFSQKQKGVENTQIPYTIADRDLMREMLITMKLGFENMNKRFDDMDKRLDAMDKVIQANRDALEKRIAFLETLMIALLTAMLMLIASLGAYIIWVQKREHQLAQDKARSKDVQKTKSIEAILQRLEKLEKQNLSLNN